MFLFCRLQLQSLSTMTIKNTQSHTHTTIPLFVIKLGLVCQSKSPLEGLVKTLWHDTHRKDSLLTKSSKAKRSISRSWVWHHFEKSWLRCLPQRLHTFVEALRQVTIVYVPNINCKQHGQQITKYSFKTLNTHGSHSWKISASPCYSRFTLLWTPLEELFWARRFNSEAHKCFDQ